MLPAAQAVGAPSEPANGSRSALSWWWKLRYDHLTGNRFRHGTRLLRWRPDKAPEQCTFDQLERELSPHLVEELLEH